MKGSLAALLAFAFTLAACEGGGADGGSPTARPSAIPDPRPTESSSASATTTTPTVQGPTPEPVLQLPPDAPTSFDGVVTKGGPFEPLVPPGAEVLNASLGQPSAGAPAFAWLVWGRGDDPFARELGVVLWEEFPVGWRATHAFTDEPAEGVLGISLDVADVTGDGLEDALTFEQTGGTGACGRWRVIAPFHGGATLAMKRQTCDAEISIVGDHLELREAVYQADDAHCCPSAFRTTTLRWDGEAFVETDVREEPTT